MIRKLLNRIPLPEALLIIALAFIPLLFAFPYRINVFLAWDGAYRISEGLIPYKDFGTPVGYVFWLIPAMFFKLFGANVFSLIISQSFINAVAGFTFLGVLKQLNVTRTIRGIGLIVFVLTYSIYNIWPWYNHFVFVLELLALWSILKGLNSEDGIKSILWIALAGFISVLGFLTKQDTGALTFILGLGLIGCHFYTTRKWKPVIYYLSGFLVGIGLLIVPFLSYEFSYWFNMGQAPHSSRINVFDLFHEFLGSSKFIKLYLLFYVLIIGNVIIEKGTSGLLKNLPFYFITLFILFQASVIQVTSYTPTDGNIYFHSFAIVFLISGLGFSFEGSKRFVVVALVFTTLWASGSVWNRFLSSKVKSFLNIETNSEVVSKNTFKIDTDQTESRSAWIVSDIPTFNKIKLPKETVSGIKRLIEISESMNSEELEVLNFTELTQLSEVLNYSIESGSHIPLWYHKGVSFFERERDLYCEKIQNQQYDIILFEDIPDLNNFYSYDVFDCIEEHYEYLYEFKAPRVPEISSIKVFIRR